MSDAGRFDGFLDHIEFTKWETDFDTPEDVGVLVDALNGLRGG